MRLKKHSIGKKIVSALLTTVMIISAFPITSFAASTNLGEVSGASDIAVTAEFNYGHEIHYGTVNGNKYPLFCVEYGTTSPSSSYLKGKKTMASDKVVQAAKWIFAGYYMEHGNAIDKLDMAYCQKKVWSIMGDSTSWTFTDSGYKAWCDNAEKNMELIKTKPSFNNKNVGNIIAGQSLTITDTNKVLKDYPAFTNKETNGVTITHKSGENTLTITVSKDCTSTAFSILNDTYFKNDTGDDDELLLYYPYGSEAYQKLIYSAYYDPVSMALSGTVTPLGDLKIVKTSEDGIVSGITFTITGTNYSKTATTDSNGVIQLNDLVPGTYTVIEEKIGNYVNQDQQTITVHSNKTSTVSFSNALKKFKVNVTKVDIEKTHPQGDASLAGAVYGIYENDKLVDRYTTDKDGKFTTKYYVCGDNWTIKEITPSEGYLLDTTVHHVGAEAKNYTVELNTTSNTVKEQVIKGKISIIKHSDDGSTKIETPEKGAEFQIYLKSAGSFANAIADEKDILVCDEDGFASSKLLPYGVYTVHQTKGWDGREKIADFDVYVKDDGKTYKFLINNANFMSYLKVVKVDKETKKDIAYEGAAFEIYDSDGHRVTMQYTYPQVTSIHTFYTNKEGYLITPEKLPYGTYSLVEVNAPYGYVLDSTPIPFSINQESSSTDTGVTVVKVKAQDIAQKGIINVEKTGEVFASVSNSDLIYTPIYEAQKLKSAVFEIYAAEDITTLDGTVRVQQGEKVDEITTGSNGIATSKELYLGKYTVIEKTAPNTFVNSGDQYDVELVYAGQNISVTNTDLSVYNERQKVTVSLKKILEENETFNIGMNGEIELISFGLFANEKIIASDGKEIPKDGWITSAHCDENGNITFDCDLPIGYSFYVVELSTDDHYILDETKYEFSTKYQGQSVPTIDIKINDDKEILNELVYGSVKGYKFDRETTKGINGVTFGLFLPDETKFTKDTAIMVTTTDENGVFEFNELPFGDYIICEIAPADGYLANSDIHHIHIYHDEQVINLNIVNDRIPEIRTLASVNGEKEVCATEIFTLTDTVEYKHLIPYEEYKVTGILMDKSTGKPFLIDGKEITSEVTFTPTEPSGTVDVLFTFDSKYIKTETDIVIFESLYKDKVQLTIHADINDQDQTVKVKIPNIKTKATVNGKKKVAASKKITIKDTVTYTNLTVGKEYTIKGILMDKSTGKPFKVDCENVVSEIKFTPKESNGTVTLSFTFDASAIKKTTDVVVFESLYRDNVEIATHADIKDKGQTITITVPKPKTPKTGDRNYGPLIGLGLVGLGGCIAGIILKIRLKKDEDDE